MQCGDDVTLGRSGGKGEGLGWRRGGKSKHMIDGPQPYNLEEGKW